MKSWDEAKAFVDDDVRHTALKEGQHDISAASSRYASSSTQSWNGSSNSTMEEWHVKGIR